MSALDVFEQDARAQTAAAHASSSASSSSFSSSVPRPITTGTMAFDMPPADGPASPAPGIHSDTGELTDAARDALIEEIDMKRRRLKVRGDIAADDTAKTALKLTAIHGDQSVLVDAARDAGLFDPETRDLAGKMAEETFANDLRALADSMGVPDWLKEAEMALKLREKSIATKIVTRDLMDKVSARNTEAQDAMQAVDKVSDLLARNVEVIRGRIREHFDNLQSVLRRRERVLLDAVDEVAKRKNAVLDGQRQEVSQAMQVIDTADHEATTAMDGDDIDYLHAYLSDLNDRLEVAAETFVTSKPYCTADVPCSFGHSTLETIIGGHGTVGNIEELAVGGPTGFGMLQWDSSRTDSRLEISKDGHSLAHVGVPGKATSMATTGFANGRNLWRIVPRGTCEGQWISLGVCTAGKIGTAAYSQDSVIFSFTPGAGSGGERTHSQHGGMNAEGEGEGETRGPVKILSHTPVKHKQNEKFDVSPGDLVAISLDCATGTVEYYKNSLCVKTALLFAAKPERPTQSKLLSGSPSKSSSRAGTAGSAEDKLEKKMSRRGSRGGPSPEMDELPADETVWYPFATLYEKGQSVTFVKAG